MICTKKVTLMFRGAYKHFEVCQRVPNPEQNLGKPLCNKLTKSGMLVAEGSPEHKAMQAKLEADKEKAAKAKDAPSAAARVVADVQKTNKK